MLIHPTLDQLQALGLQGMAKAFTNSTSMATPPRSVMPSGWPCCSTGKPPGGTTRGSARAFDTPNCGTRPHLKMSTTEAPAVSSAGCSKRC